MKAAASLKIRSKSRSEATVRTEPKRESRGSGTPGGSHVIHSFKEAWTEAVERLNLRMESGEYLTFHDLRRTAVKHMNAGDLIDAYSQRTNKNKVA